MPMCVVPEGGQAERRKGGPCEGSGALVKEKTTFLPPLCERELGGNREHQHPGCEAREKELRKGQIRRVGG